MSSSTLPILPLPHPTILLPASRATLPLNRYLAQALINLIQDSETDGQTHVAAIPIVNSPTAGAEPVLNDWGVVARVIRLARTSGVNATQAPYLLSVQGLTRVRLTRPLKLSSHSPEKLTFHAVEHAPAEAVPSHETVEAFKSASLRLLDRLAQDSNKLAKRDAWLKLASMVEDVTDQRAGWLADLLVSSISGEYSDRLELLSVFDVEDRLKRTTQLFIKQASISEVSRKIASAVDESLSNQQKEFFLRQQLAAIQKELNSLHAGGTSPGGSELDENEQQQDADDMAEIKRKIEAMEHGSEERKMGVREWRRLKRIPQGSVENGVIRSYLEWLTALPWHSSTSAESSLSLETLKDRSFLRKARQQLDADHFGLDKIKRRLIEYLAVVRLKQLALAAEHERDTQALIQAPILPAVESAGDMSKALVKVDGKADSPSSQKQLPALSVLLTKPRRKAAVKGPILLFVGPPGTGKTSLGQSIARALNRPFQRISLGGVRDEAEIRGHRRTYVASGPGMIAQALRKAGRLDPVILLDEIDKIGQSNYHGDPSAALLEVLDPEQNHSFNDHYINVPIDLSQVLFICTSNTLDTIPGPLLDRCEIVQLSGYTYDEKTHIARRFLLPKQLEANGLDAAQIDLREDTLLQIATRYTREAGVRSLERAIGAVVRYKAVQWADYCDAIAEVAVTPSTSTTSSATKQPTYTPTILPAELEAILGIARWEPGGSDEESEMRAKEARRGVVYGLVVMGQGEGGILPVETIAVPAQPGGGLKLTGSLGEVIKESGELALSWVKTHAYALGITDDATQDPLKIPGRSVDVHLHLPAGAQKKDGPSAGIAMTCALVSLLTGALVPTDTAMTGEITLRGLVTPVGGIKEKVLGAHRAGIKRVILPAANRKDVFADVPPEVRAAVECVFVRRVEEVVGAVFGGSVGRIGAGFGTKKGIEGREKVWVESRL